MVWLSVPLSLLISWMYTSLDQVGELPRADGGILDSRGRARHDHQLGLREAYRNMLRRFAKPGSVVAVVWDSYDISYAISEHWGRTQRDEVIRSGATLVVRPDSGDPVDVVHKCLVLLDEAFGGPGRCGVCPCFPPDSRYDRVRADAVARTLTRRCIHLIYVLRLQLFPKAMAR